MRGIRVPTGAYSGRECVTPAIRPPSRTPRSSPSRSWHERAPVHKDRLTRHVVEGGRGEEDDSLGDTARAPPLIHLRAGNPPGAERQVPRHVLPIDNPRRDRVDIDLVG